MKSFQVLSILFLTSLATTALAKPKEKLYLKLESNPATTIGYISIPLDGWAGKLVNFPTIEFVDADNVTIKIEAETTEAGIDLSKAISLHQNKDVVNLVLDPQIAKACDYDMDRAMNNPNIPYQEFQKGTCPQSITILAPKALQGKVLAMAGGIGLAGSGGANAFDEVNLVLKQADSQEEALKNIQDYIASVKKINKGLFFFYGINDSILDAILFNFDSPDVRLSLFKSIGASLYCPINLIEKMAQKISEKYFQGQNLEEIRKVLEQRNG